MKKILFMLALVFASNSYACEWKLTVTNLITNELKYYQASQKPQFVELYDATNKRTMQCTYSIDDILKLMPPEQLAVARKAENALIGCLSNDGYLNVAKATRVELKSGHTHNASAVYEVINAEKDQSIELYRLILRCE